MNRKFVITLALLIIAPLIIQRVLLGNAPAVRLGSAPALSGIVAQSLASGGGKTSLPQPGRDFSLKNVQYFESQQWAVATIEPLTKKLNRAVVVLQRQSNNGYEVVLGPGSAFDSNYLHSLPTDVAGYLGDNGAIYGSVNQ